MPRHKIAGRFCENPYCRREIDPERPKGTRFCDSSCRSEAWKVKTGELATPTTAKALKGVASKRRKASREHVPRAPTPYCVLKFTDAGEAFGGMEILGFAAATNKTRAIRRVAGTSEELLERDHLVAVPVSQLRRHFPDGSAVAEDPPSWTA